MNNIFAEATTSTAFILQLSKNQCNHVLRLEGKEPQPFAYGQNKEVTTHLHGMGLLDMTTLKALEVRGLVWWKRDAQGAANGFQGLTKAGELVLGLLKEAGMTVESTNTVSMLKRIAA